MEGGDIDNREMPRLWFQWEGLLAEEPVYTQMRRMLKRRQMRELAARSKTNHSLRIAMLDLSWRKGLRFSVMSFLFGDDSDWQEALEKWVQFRDLPASAYAFSYDRFREEVVLSPSCWAVYIPAPSPVLPAGGKVSVIHPRSQFILQ